MKDKKERKLNEYFAYRGDEFLIVGTMKEIAEYLEIKNPRVVATKSKNRKRGLYIEKLEDIED